MMNIIRTPSIPLFLQCSLPLIAYLYKIIANNLQHTIIGSLMFTSGTFDDFLDYNYCERNPPKYCSKSCSKLYAWHIMLLVACYIGSTMGKNSHV